MCRVYTTESFDKPQDLKKQKLEFDSIFELWLVELNVSSWTNKT